MAVRAVPTIFRFTSQLSRRYQHEWRTKNTNLGRWWHSGPLGFSPYWLLGGLRFGRIWIVIVRCRIRTVDICVRGITVLLVIRVSLRTGRITRVINLGRILSVISLSGAVLLDVITILLCKLVKVLSLCGVQSSSDLDGTLWRQLRGLRGHLETLPQLLASIDHGVVDRYADRRFVHHHVHAGRDARREHFRVSKAARVLFGRPLFGTWKIVPIFWKRQSLHVISCTTFWRTSTSVATWNEKREQTITVLFIYPNGRKNQKTWHFSNEITKILRTTNLPRCDHVNHLNNPRKPSEW